ncbi:MAG: hypothetical protein JW772_03285, partial [Candidatus Diapherotrites archaeon]|nr:hypothetical protein [Candidatus Diapherotrites archaeon]
NIFNAIAASGATALLTSEKVEDAPGISRDTISEFLCDNILMLHYLGVGSVEFRSMRILKMRLSNHEKHVINYSISDKGIVLEKASPI